MINTNPIATTQASSIPTEVDAKTDINWLNVKFHDGTGTVVTSDGDISSIDIDTDGTSTHQWAEPGWWSASDGASAGDRLFRDELNTAVYEALGRMDDITDGSYMICADFYVGNKTGGGVEMLLSFGTSAGAYWQGFKFQTNGDIEFFMQDGDGHNEVCDMPNANYSVDTRFTVGFHIDIANSTIDSYINDTATPVDTGDISDFTAYPTAADSSPRGFTVMANGGGLNPAAILGTTVRDIRVANLLIIKDSGSGVRANAQKIVADMYSYPGDLPEVLRDL